MRLPAAVPFIETAYAIIARPRKGRVSRIRESTSMHRMDRMERGLVVMRRQEACPLMVSLSNHAYTARRQAQRVCAAARSTVSASHALSVLPSDFAAAAAARCTWGATRNGIFPE